MELENNVVSSCKNQRKDFMPIEENLVLCKINSIPFYILLDSFLDV